MSRFFTLLATAIFMFNMAQAQLTVDAGPDDNACNTMNYPIVSAYVQSYTEVWWETSGDGWFDNANIVGAVYNPGANDEMGIPVTLTLYATDGADTLYDATIITFSPTFCASPTAFAGNDDSICPGYMYAFNQAWAMDYTNVMWTTSGDGFFNDSYLVQPTYTMGANDELSGIVTITLTAWNASDTVVDDMELSLKTECLPTAYAGTDGFLCGTGFFYLGEAWAQNFLNVEWTTSGDGSFANAYLVDPQYNPGPNDISLGTVTLTMMVWDTDTATDDMILTIDTACTPCNMSADFTKGDASAQGMNDGWIQINVYNGAAPFTYEWSDIGPGSDFRDNLYYGSYSVTITDNDSCTAELYVDIYEGPLCNMYLTYNKADVTDSAATDGWIQIYANNGMAPFTYEWSDIGPGSDYRDNLALGYYGVTVTDNDSCTAELGIDIYELDPCGAFYCSLYFNNPSTPGMNDGSAWIDTSSISGGAPPFSFLWSTAESTPDINNLLAGEYSVIVTDDNGCMYQDSVLLEDPDTLCSSFNVYYDITGATDSVSNDGEIDLTVTGGTAPYQFAWSDGPSTDEDRTGLALGWYNFSVTDDNGCYISMGAEIGILDTNCYMYITFDHANESSPGMNDGWIQIYANNGQAPFTYNWSDIGIGSDYRDSLAPGNYTVTVTDNKGCIDSMTVGIDAASSCSMYLNYDKADVTDSASTDGWIQIYAINGVAPFTYEWSDIGPGSDYRDNLAIGSYGVTVTDNDSCSAEIWVDVNEFDPCDAFDFYISMEATSGSGMSDGSAWVNEWDILNGTAPFTYLWSTAETLDSISGLTAGTYWCSITEDNGCSKQKTFVIMDMDTVCGSFMVNFTKIDPTDSVSNDGSINITASGGLPPYMYAWGDGPNVEDRTGLSYGFYSVTVTDQNTCEQMVNIDLNPPAGCSMWISYSKNDLSGIGTNDGSIDITPMDGTAPFTYTWGDGPTTEDRVGLMSGTYSVTVYDDDGCDASLFVDIFEPGTSPTVDAGSDFTSCPIVSMVLYQANASNFTSIWWTTTGSGYFTNDMVVTPEYYFGAGDELGGTITFSVYAANATDTAFDQVVVTVFPKPTADAGVDQTISLGNSANLTASGGVDYFWSNGANTASCSVSPTTTTIYYVTVQDGNMCQDMDSVTVIVSGSPLAVFAGIDAFVCAGGVYGINDASVTGGLGGYSYTWTTMGSGMFSNNTVLNPVYTPSAGDEMSGSVYIILESSDGSDIEVDTMMLTIGSGPLVNAGSDVNISIGDSAYLTASGAISYLWSTGNATASVWVYPTVSSSYTVTGTDAQGCSATDVVNVTISGTPPTVSVGPDVTGCAAIGGNFVLGSATASGHDDVSWTTSGTGTFDDPTAINTNYNFSAGDIIAGSVTLTLTATNTSGSNNDAMVLTLQQSPIVNLGPDTTICSGSWLDLVAPMNPSYSYSWSTGQTTQIVQVWPAGYTEYSVTVTDSIGCSGTDNIAVSIQDVLAGYTSTIDSANLTIQFTNTSTGALQYSWDFGDGAGSTNANPVHTYTQGGFFPVCLEATNQVFGCVNTFCDTIVVTTGQCMADFNLSVDTLSMSLTATNLSTPAILDYLWDFGDGNTSTDLEPAYMYNDAGTYNVCLNVLSPLSGCQATKCQTVTVGVDVIAADFNFYIVDSTNTAFFFGQSADNITSWKWNFDDGGLANGQNSSHQFINSGVYNVCLTVFDDLLGVQYTICKDIAIGNDITIARFNYFIDSTNTVHFEDMSTGNPAFWNWNFGDGQTSANPYPSHQYLTQGQYNVCLTVIDTIMHRNSQKCKLVNIGTNLLVANFDFFIDDTTNTVYFDDRSLGNPTNWTWNFGDGVTSILPNPSHQYAFSGVYTVSLSVLDNVTGRTAQIFRDIVIGNDLTVARFDYFVADSVNRVFFTDRSTGAPETWYWTFGDGGYSTIQNPEHQYFTSGVYPVCLKVTDSLNRPSTKCKNVQIGNSILMAFFDFYIDDATLTVNFSDHSLGNIHKWYWTFGNFATSQQRNPTKVFPHPGNYPVKLVVKDTVANISDEFVVYMQIGTPECIGNFEYSVIPDSNKVVFTDMSIGSIVSRTWNFGDGTTSNALNPVHYYGAAGMYTVCLTVSNPSGVMHQYCEQVQVGTINCSAAFNVFVDSLTNIAFFQNDVLGNSTTLNWEFGDGGISSAFGPAHYYAAPGYYVVTLNTNDPGTGCQDAHTKVILIGSAGIDCEAEFIYQSDDLLNGYFYDMSAGDIQSWIWNFGDGDSASVQDPVHTFTQPGMYNVCLTVRNNFGIPNTTCKPVQIGDGTGLCFANFFYNVDSITRTASFVDESFGDIDVFDWNFGDSTTHSSDANPTHTYATPGYYFVILTVENTASGCFSQFSDMINVGAGDNGLFGGFGYDVDSNGFKSNQYPVDFKGAAFGDPAVISWAFGDGSGDSTTMDPTHVYSALGTYNVCLTVGDPVTGDSHTACQEITIDDVTDVVTVDMRETAFDVYPNPFNNETQIEFSLKLSGMTEIAVFDMMGRKQQVLAEGEYTAGYHNITWDRGNLPNGIYYLQLTSGSETLTQRVVLVK
ncbi:MAG: PKD domain-containing protein [Bacteroidetes bacterium]|nr:PKD domain-containing protein [Bacteroidota bacterium]MBU1720531.1 PKD domain-containing protein [Bacteroidota bacterium]